MAQWEDYAGDEWLRPLASQDTRTKEPRDGDTRGLKPRPRLQPPPFQPGDRWGDFVLDQWIGSGSQGWVFSARDQATDKPVALKILADNEEPETTMAKTGFRRMAKLRHRNLMNLDRIHETSRGVAFSMERIDGINLTAAIRQWRSLPLQQACDHLIEMVRQMGSAIGWMHARQLVHRDLKPSNIMITHDESRFVLIDYDLTGTFDHEPDSEKMRSYLVWTPMYVAPEVLVRQRHSPASDVFSLGMVVLEALRVFSVAQWERESSQDEAEPIANVDAETTPIDETIPRDKSDSDQDHQLIHDAVRGLHPDAPEILTDALMEMLSPLESDRPMAMTLSRLGMPLTTVQMTRITDVDSGRLRDSTQRLRHTELARVHRWSHLVLGGAVQRLHIEGESGIGKSSLLDLALTQLRSQPWAQVFVARCQQRDQKPLQAFSQIADEITMRFRTMDREMLQVDSVTESLLTDILPGLAEVLEVDWSQPRLETSPTRPGGLEAAMKVCERLREYGPVFFIIDDVQWADRDTISTLDYLQSACLGRPGLPALQGFGLVTVSRPDGDQQMTLPDETIRVGRLPRETTADLLLDEAAKHSVTLSLRQTDDLAREIDGLPYRLDAYLEEIRSGTLFDKTTPDSSASVAGKEETAVPTMESLWQRNCAGLDAVAMLWLRRIAAAGREVHVDELRGWGGEANGVESASQFESLLDQLQANRLIVREGIAGEMLRVWHARLGEQVLASIDEQSIRQLHAWWAETLSQVRPELANVITSHYLRAEVHEPVSHWATLAAGQAQRMYAHREVASWHRVAAQHSEGDAKCASLRAVAEAFHRCGSIRDAADVHAELASLLEGPAKLEHEIKHVECLVRSGEFRDLGSQLRPLIERLQMPRPKSRWAFKLSCAWRSIRLVLMRQNIADLSRETPANRSPRDAFRLQACVRLIQPMSIIENRIATEWGLFAARQVRLHGTVGERVQLGVGEAVFGSYQPGRMRAKSAALLAQMRDQLRPDDDPFWHASVHCGLGWSAIMDGRHEDSINEWLVSKRFYAMSEQLASFELAHMAYGELQAYWQTGRLKSLRRVAGEMLAEGGTTNDQFVLIMGTLGAGSIAFLAADDLARLDAAERGVRECLHRVGPDSFGFIQSFRNAFTTLYKRDLSQAMTQLEWLPRAIRRSPIRRVQMIRLALRELKTLMSMQAMQEEANDARGTFQGLIRSLRRERSPLATMKANLFEGTVLARSVKPTERESAGEMLVQARDVAMALRLTPNVLAAEDELRWLNQPSASSALEDFLADQNVVSPMHLARIYRGVDRPSISPRT